MFASPPGPPSQIAASNASRYVSRASRGSSGSKRRAALEQQSCRVGAAPLVERDLAAEMIGRRAAQLGRRLRLRRRQEPECRVERTRVALRPRRRPMSGLPARRVRASAAPTARGAPMPRVALLVTSPARPNAPTRRRSRRLARRSSSRGATPAGRDRGSGRSRTRAPHERRAALATRRRDRPRRAPTGAGSRPLHRTRSVRPPRPRSPRPN